MELGDDKRAKVIGFVIGYPHPRSVPFRTKHIWMIGFMATNNRCIKKYKIDNQQLISTMIINLFDLIHEPEITIDVNSNSNPKSDKNLKYNINTNRKCIDFDYGMNKAETMTKCLCIYCPIYQTSGHKIYQKLGFTKVARIQNYYATDHDVFENIYRKNKVNLNYYYNTIIDDTSGNYNYNDDDNDNINNNKYNREKYVDAFLFCKSTSAPKTALKLYRLALALEYFNYKKWGSKDHSITHFATYRMSNPSIKRPKIVEEFLLKFRRQLHLQQENDMIEAIDFVNDVDIKNKVDKNSWRRWKRAQLAHLIYKHLFSMRGLPYLCDVIASYCIGTGALIFALCQSGCMIQVSKSAHLIMS